VGRPVEPDAKAASALGDEAREALRDLTQPLEGVDWSREAIEGVVGEVAERRGTKLGKLAGPIRAALAGRSVTPSVFDMMLVLGREESLARLGDAAQDAPAPAAGA
jgi:glutamyl-tRNA synthetase